jgi:DNA-binding transcriptional LysR family regulator
LTTEQLRYFAAIAENGSFSSTAVQMDITQSSVTKQIKALETELGVELFDRSKRRVSLTEAGRTAYKDVKAVLEKMDTLLLHAQEYGNTKKNRIEIAALPIMGQYGLAIAFQQFAKMHPEITLCIREAEEIEILELLHNSKCDLAIMREEILPEGHYKTYFLVADELALFVNKNHPLAAKASVSPEQLAREPFMLMPKHTGVYQFALKLCHSAGFEPNVLQYARIETILSSVEIGTCSSLLMKQISNVFHSHDIKIVPIIPKVVSKIVATINPAVTVKKNTIELCEFLSGGSPFVPGTCNN